MYFQTLTFNSCPLDYHGALNQSVNRSLRLFTVCWKKFAQYESCELSFIWGKMRTAAWEAVLQKALEVVPRRQGKELGCIGVWQQRASSWNIKKWLLIKENQVSQVKELGAFLHVGRCNSLDSLKSFLWYAPQYLGPVSCMFTSWVSSGLTLGTGLRLMASRWQVLFSLEFVQGSPAHVGWWWHPLFNWYGRKYTIYHLERRQGKKRGKASPFQRSQTLDFTKTILYKTKKHSFKQESARFWVRKGEVNQSW